MHIKTTGIILYKKTTGENDSIVTMLTDEHGVLSCYLKGSRRLSTGTSAPTQQLCYSSFVLFKNRDRYSIDSAEVIEPFTKLRSDIVKLSLACYFGELVKELCSDAGSIEFLRLFLNTLSLLERDKKDLKFLKSVFEMRLLSMTGYMPDLTQCCECGSPAEEGAVFCFADAVLFCKKCAGMQGEETGQVFLTPAVLAALRHISCSPPSKIFSFTLSQASLDSLADITERYLLSRIEHPLGTLDFYKSTVSF